MNFSQQKFRIFNYDHFKRICDFSLALIIFFIGFPFFIIISIVIMISSKGNPIFIQKRTGYKGKAFNIYKFRSMHINKKRKSAQVFINNREFHI